MIFKFNLGRAQVGINYKILTAKEQNNKAVVYIDTDPKQEQVDIFLFAYYTGEESKGTYINTVMLNSGALVAHIFLED